MSIWLPASPDTSGPSSLRRTCALELATPMVWGQLWCGGGVPTARFCHQKDGNAFEGRGGQAGTRSITFLNMM